MPILYNYTCIRSFYFSCCVGSFQRNVNFTNEMYNLHFCHCIILCKNTIDINVKCKIQKMKCHIVLIPPPWEWCFPSAEGRHLDSVAPDFAI